MSARPRLVLGAFVCHPSRGSEPGVGWNRALESSRFGEVHVLTHDEGNRGAVERAVRDRGLTGLHFHFVEHSPLGAALMGRGPTYYAGYRRWQRRAYLKARELHEREPFDLAHQVNMCGYREPGELWRLGIPFVWGPVGGTQNTPAAFLAYGGAGMAVREGVRTVLNGVQLRTSRRVRRAARSADVVLAANSTGRRDLEGAFGVGVRQLLETGVRGVGEPKRWADRAPGPFRLLWAGEVVQRKGIRVALEAVRRARAFGLEVELVVVGDGPARAEAQAAEGVECRGLVPRHELLGLYRHADALAFTSLRDTSGNVMLEALAAGLPVVYLDHQGAADMGSAECGVPVAVTTPEEAVAGVARGVRALATDPALHDRLSVGAVARAEELHWRRNGAAMNEVYASLLGRRPHAGDGASHAAADRLVARASVLDAAV